MAMQQVRRRYVETVGGHHLVDHPAVIMIATLWFVVLGRLGVKVGDGADQLHAFFITGAAGWFPHFLSNTRKRGCSRGECPSGEEGALSVERCQSGQ